MDLVPRYVQRALALLVLLTCSLLAACKQAPTPTVAPRPTPRPTATPGLEQALEGSLFEITFNETLLATEELHVGEADARTVLFSEIRRFLDYSVTERRTVVLSTALTPVRYDVEKSALGLRSIWVGERNGDSLDYVNNNLSWGAPILVNGISPAPDIMVDGSPSAWPFALLALRFGADRASIAAADLHAMDLLEDSPQSRPLVLTRASDRTGAIIGTIALDGHVAGGPAERFTLWVRPGGRTLFSVEIPEYRFGFWEQLAHPALRGQGRLVIRRVGALPALPDFPDTGTVRGEAVGFTGADNGVRRGVLRVPEGQGPFPCVVVHADREIAPRWDPSDAFLERGWATYVYDPRGTGESDGAFARGGISSLAEDAVAAAVMLGERQDIDPERIVFLGLGEGGLVGGVALAMTDLYSAAVLASCAVEGPVFPTLAEHRLRGPLASFYDWSGLRVDAFHRVSVTQWQRWLFDGTDEIPLLRRRFSFRGLSEQAEIDLAETLAQSQAQVLLLHGRQDSWTPVAGAMALRDELSAVAPERIALQVLDGLGADLGSEGSTGAFDPSVDEIMFGWLDKALPTD